MVGTERPPPVKSAHRTIDLIEYIADNGPISFNDISSRLRWPRSSTHGLLHTLLGSGWVHYDPQRKVFSLGLRAWQTGQRYAGHRALVEQAQPIMNQLVAAVGETVQLARLDGIENVYIAISESPEPMRLASSVGMRLHSHATGIGKALLSQLDPAEAERRLRADALPRLTEHTITDVDLITTELAAIRQRGYAIDDGEFTVGCRCVAVPVATSPDGNLVAALSITMPTSRTDQDWPHSLHEPLVQAANAIRPYVIAS